MTNEEFDKACDRRVDELFDGELQKDGRHMTAFIFWQQGDITEAEFKRQEAEIMLEVAENLRFRVICGDLPL